MSVCKLCDTDWPTECLDTFKVSSSIEVRICKNCQIGVIHGLPIRPQTRGVIVAAIKRGPND